MKTKPNFLEPVDSRFLQSTPPNHPTPARFYRDCQFLDLLLMSDSSEVRNAIECLHWLLELLHSPFRTHCRVEAILLGGQTVVQRNLGAPGTCIILTRDTVKQNVTIDPLDGSRPKTLANVIENVTENLDTSCGLFTQVATDGSALADNLLTTFGDSEATKGPIAQILEPSQRDLQMTIQEVTRIYIS